MGGIGQLGKGLTASAVTIVAAAAVVVFEIDGWDPMPELIRPMRLRRRRAHPDRGCGQLGRMSRHICDVEHAAWVRERARAVAVAMAGDRIGETVELRTVACTGWLPVAVQGRAVDGRLACGGWGGWGVRGTLCV